MGRLAIDRAAYRMLLETNLRLNVVAESDFKPVSVWSALRHNPGLALVVADQCDNEIRAALDIVPRVSEATRILVVGSSRERPVLLAWGKCPISGYVLKEGGVDEIRCSIGSVLRGKRYFSRGIEALMFGGNDAGGALEGLSSRETELLSLLARGLTLRDAAAEMTIAYKTADGYRTKLMQKLHLRDRVQLVHFAIREGIVDA